MTSSLASVLEVIRLHGLTRLDGALSVDTLGAFQGLAIDNGGDKCPEGMTMASTVTVSGATSATFVGLINVSGVERIRSDVLVSSHCQLHAGLRLAPRTGMALEMDGNIKVTSAPQGLSNGIFPVIHVKVVNGVIKCSGQRPCTLIGSPSVVTGLHNEQDAVMFKDSDTLDLGRYGVTLGTAWTVDCHFRMPLEPRSSGWHILTRSDNGDYQVCLRLVRKMSAVL